LPGHVSKIGHLSFGAARGWWNACSLPAKETHERRLLAQRRPEPIHAAMMTTGIVNLFGDITYEAAASINGPFMASLGAKPNARHWPLE